MMASEMLRIRRISFIGAAIFFAVWLVWWLQPEHRLRAKAENLLEALEDADRSDLQKLLDSTYSDPWHDNRDEAIGNAIEASKQFYSLKITPMDYRVATGADFSGTVSFRPRLEGDGTPVAPMIRERVDRLDQPFTLTWRRQPWKPWSWTVHRVENPSLKSIDR
ncbi:MAG: hypothetical protein ACKO2G_07965 [Verrucomicrobiales bacterium]